MRQTQTMRAGVDLETPSPNTTERYTADGIGEGMKIEYDALSRAFEELRKLGFVTDEGDSCCFGCMGGNICNTAAPLRDDDLPVNGFVGYFIQEDTDYDAFHELGGYYVEGRAIDDPSRTIRRQIQPTIRYGNIDLASGEIGLGRQTVGEIVTAVFDSHGVSYEWSGDGSDFIHLR